MNIGKLVEIELYMILNLVMLFYSDGTFYLWETNTWTSEQWSSTSGFVKVYGVYIHVLELYDYDDDLFTVT